MSCCSGSGDLVRLIDAQILSQLLCNTLCLHQDMGTVILGKLESGSISKAQQLVMMPNRVRSSSISWSQVKLLLLLTGCLPVVKIIIRSMYSDVIGCMKLTGIEFLRKTN